VSIRDSDQNATAYAKNEAAAHLPAADATLEQTGNIEARIASNVRIIAGEISLSANCPNNGSATVEVKAAGASAWRTVMRTRT
jgi:hypothetical protein